MSTGKGLSYPFKMVGNLVFEGDSMSLSPGGSSHLTYPIQTMTLIGAARLNGYRYTVVATSGETTVDILAQASTQVDPQYNAAYTKNIAILWAGTNDIRETADDAQTIYARIVSWCEGRRTAGFKVVVLTILPADYPGDPPDFLTRRGAINALLRANWTAFADGLVDAGADPSLGDDGNEQNTTYYADKLHLTDSGKALVAALVKAEIGRI